MCCALVLSLLWASMSCALKLAASRSASILARSNESRSSRRALTSCFVLVCNTNNKQHSQKSGPWSFDALDFVTYTQKTSIHLVVRRKEFRSSFALSCALTGSDFLLILKGSNFLLVRSEGQ